MDEKDERLNIGGSDTLCLESPAENGRVELQVGVDDPPGRRMAS